LFLSTCWAEDSDRCEAAGIPVSEQIHLIKRELALKLVKQAIAADVDSDFIAGDGLYGHNSELARSLDALEQFYVLDIHKDELVYLTELAFRVPKRKGNTSYRMVSTWQHHMALVMMAGLQILQLKLEAQDEMPMMSVRDARLLVLPLVLQPKKKLTFAWEHIRIRHVQRKKIWTGIHQIFILPKLELT
jgi:hypothetical protein